MRLTASPPSALFPLGARLGEQLRLLRADVNERVAYLDRRQLVEVYGRAAVRNALRQARSVRALSPAGREFYLLNRARKAAEVRRGAATQRVRALEIKARLGAELDLPLRQYRDQLATLQEELRTLEARLSALSATIAGEREALRERGVELADDEVSFAHGLLTYADLLRRRCLRRQGDFELRLEKALTRAVKEAARLAPFQPALRGAVRENVEYLLLACPPGHDPLRFCAEKLAAATGLLADLVTHPLVKGVEFRSVLQLFEELLKVVTYPGYVGELAIGFGGTEDPPNIRLPAYLLPGLVALRRFLGAGLPVPRLRVLNAYAIATAFNNIDGARAKENALATQRLLAAFVERFFPDCAPHVRFTLPEEGQFSTDPAFTLALRFLEGFGARHPENKQYLSLLRKAWKHNPRLRRIAFDALDPAQREELADIARRYVAAHVVEQAFGDVRRHGEGAHPAEYAVKIGGDGENDFNFFEDILTNLDCFGPGPGRFYRPNSSGLAKEGMAVNPIQLNAVTGSTPPYYAASPEEVQVSQVGEFTFQEVLYYYRSDSRLRSVAVDLEMFERVGISGEDYFAFLRDHQAGRPGRVPAAAAPPPSLPPPGEGRYSGRMDRLVELIASQLGEQVGNINEDSGPQTLSSWDSFRHLELVLAVEKEFGVQLAADEVMGISSVRTLRQVLVRHGKLPAGG